MVVLVVEGISTSQPPEGSCRDSGCFGNRVFLQATTKKEVVVVLVIEGISTSQPPKGSCRDSDCFGNYMNMCSRYFNCLLGTCTSHICTQHILFSCGCMVNMQNNR